MIFSGVVHFRLERSVRKNRTTFSDVSMRPEIFRCNDPKRRFPFAFQPDFPELFVNDKLPFSPVWPAPAVHTSVENVAENAVQGLY